jgi:hypothetical protein
MSFLLGLIFQLPALAVQSVTLQWTPSADTNVAGYRIYYGTASHVYTASNTVGNVTTASIGGLADATTYFFAATTMDAVGDESGFSNEASFTTAAAVIINTPPAITNAAPVAAVVTNQPPSLNNLNNLNLNLNSGAQTIALTGISPGTAAKNSVLKITVATSNPYVIAKPTVNYTSPKSTGTLVLKPNPGFIGTSVITVSINNGAKSNNITTKYFTVTVVAPPNPFIPRFSRLMTNTFATVGQTVTFSVAVTGKAPFKYQWKYNGANLAGATSAGLTLKNVKAKQAGAYSVTVSNAAGSTNSGVALLVVSAPATTAQANDTVLNNTAANMPTAATLTSVAQAGGQFSFRVTGISGSNYVVQASSDLKNWTAVQTNTSPFTFTDVNASSFQQRFYRTYFLP